MTSKFHLAEALEQSPVRVAFRIAPLRDIWEVRVESGETPYVLIHHLSANGQQGDPLQHNIFPYRTLEDLLEDQRKRDEAVLGLRDWYPDTQENREWLKTTSPHANYSTPGFWPPV